MDDSWTVTKIAELEAKLKQETNRVEHATTLLAQIATALGLAGLMCVGGKIVLASDQDVELIRGARGEPIQVTRIGAIEAKKPIRRESYSGVEPTSSKPFPWIRLRHNGPTLELEIRFSKESHLTLLPKDREIMAMLHTITSWLAANARYSDDLPTAPTPEGEPAPQ